MLPNRKGIIMNKTTYINARKEWKESYEFHSDKIRQLKHLFKDAQREYSKTEKYGGPLWVKIERIRKELIESKADSTAMLASLADLKVEAQQSYIKEKSLVTA